MVTGPTVAIKDSGAIRLAGTEPLQLDTLHFYLWAAIMAVR